MGKTLCELLEERILLTGNYPLPAEDIAFQPGDFAILLHTNGKASQLRRFTPDSRLDPSFGRGGRLKLARYFSDIAIQPDGRILLAGTTATPRHDLILTRLLPDGSADNTFGSSGRVQVKQKTPPGSPHLAISHDGTITLAATFKRDCWIGQFTAAGAPVGKPDLVNVGGGPTDDTVIGVYDLTGNQPEVIAQSTNGIFRSVVALRLHSYDIERQFAILHQDRRTLIAAAPYVPAGANPDSQGFIIAATDGKAGYTARISANGSDDLARTDPGFIPRSIAIDNGQYIVAGTMTVGRVTRLAHIDNSGALQVGPSAKSRNATAAAGMFEGHILLDLRAGNKDMLATDTYATGKPWIAWMFYPATIEVENVDPGGEGLSYHDSTTANEGGAYRVSSVDIEASSDASGGYDLTATHPGEWLQYSILGSGPLRLGFKIASDGPGGTFHVEADGRDVTGPIQVPDTGGWHSWQYIGAITADIGQADALRLLMDKPGLCGIVGNFDSFTIMRASHVDPSFGSGGQVVLTGFDRAVSAAQQPDGKLLVVAQTGMYRDARYTLLRFNGDGSLDKSFGIEGQAKDLPSPMISVQSDGRIIVAPDDIDPTTSRLWRYLPDGTLDPSFQPPDDIGGILTIASDDKILVSAGRDLTRLLPDGALDTAFGNQGTVRLDSQIGAVSFGPDGTILVGIFQHNIREVHDPYGGLEDDYFDNYIGSATLSDAGQVLQSQLTRIPLDGWILFVRAGPGGQFAYGTEDQYPHSYTDIDALPMDGWSLYLRLDTLRDPNDQLFTNRDDENDPSGLDANVPFDGYALARQKDGKILVLGSLEGHLAIARFTL